MRRKDMLIQQHFRIEYFRALLAGKAIAAAVSGRLVLLTQVLRDKPFAAVSASVCCAIFARTTTMLGHVTVP